MAINAAVLKLLIKQKFIIPLYCMMVFFLFMSSAFAVNFADLKVRGYGDWNRLMDILQIDDQEEKENQLDEWYSEWKAKYINGVGSLRTIKPKSIDTIIFYGKEGRETKLYELLIRLRSNYAKPTYDQRFMTADHARGYVARKVAHYEENLSRAKKELDNLPVSDKNAKKRLYQIEEALNGNKEKLKMTRAKLNEGGDSLAANYQAYMQLEKEQKNLLAEGRKIMRFLNKEYAEIDYTHLNEKIKKWQTRQVSLMGQEWHHSPIYSEVYRALGIEFLHTLGLKGRDNIIGVLDQGWPFGAASTSYAVHDLLPPEIFIEGSDIPYEHGISTIGVIARQQEVVDEPPAVAPGVRVYLRKPRDLSFTYHVHYHPNLVKKGEVTRKEGILKGHLGLKMEFDILRRIFPKLKPFTITGIEVDPDYDHYLASIIDDLVARGITLVYSSLILAIGEETYQALLRFKKNGGIIIYAAGNDDYAITLNEENVIKSEQAALAFQFHWRLLKDPALAEVFLFAGSLKDSNTMSTFSTRAGNLADRYLAAFGDDNLLLVQDKYFPYKGLQREERGTSLAAPMIAGGIALLMEAFPERLYPHCTPQFLAQVLLDTTSPISKEEAIEIGGEERRLVDEYDPWVSGRGAMNLKAAFEWLASHIGPPVLPGRALDPPRRGE